MFIGAQNLKENVLLVAICIYKLDKAQVSKTAFEAQPSNTSPPIPIHTPTRPHSPYTGATLSGDRRPTSGGGAVSSTAARFGRRHRHTRNWPTGAGRKRKQWNRSVHPLNFPNQYGSRAAKQGGPCLCVLLHLPDFPQSPWGHHPYWFLWLVL